MSSRCVRIIIAVVSVALMTVWVPGPALAVHESTNTLEFELVGGAAESAAAGQGIVDFRGGDATESRWTATFQFTGLRPDESYVVAVQGRYGEQDSPEAAEFTPICQFIAGASGEGGCWYYLVVLVHLGVVQVQVGELGGPVVLQATREAGPGSIVSEPNRYSPVDPSTPAATPEASSTATARADGS